MNKLLKSCLLLAAASLLAVPGTASAKEAAQEWELVNPEGVAQIVPMQPAPRLTSLEGKTVVLRWNGKPNGNVALDRVAELLTAQVKNVKIIKAYETNPEISMISHTLEKSREIAKKLAAKNPDLVIASQAD